MATAFDDPVIGGKKVVVVDDEATQLAAIGGLLSRAGLLVDTCSSAEEALHRMGGNGAPDLIITDLHMPGIDGWKFCRLLRSPEYPAFNGTPILVVSAVFSGEDTRRITADLGANAFISVPIDGPHLLHCVATLLKGETPQHTPAVLVVDDSRSIVSVVEAAFRDTGHDVTCAFSGKEASAALRQRIVEIVVLDYHLPDTLGDAILREVRRTSPQTTVVMMTSDPSPSLATRFLQDGAAAYIRKPFDPDYLVAVCEQAWRQTALVNVAERLDERTRELRESQRRLAALVNNLPGVAYRCSATFPYEMEYLSEGCLALTGHSSGDLVGGKAAFYRRLIVPEDEAIVSCSIHEALEKQALFALEYRIRGKSGEVRWVSEHGTAVMGEDGKPIALEGFISDVTDRKRAEEEREKLKAQIRHAQKIESLGVLAGGTAHELNNILAGILGYAELTLLGLPVDSPLRKDVRATVASTQRASELAQKMLLFAGKSAPEMEPVSLPEVIREAASSCELIAASRCGLHFELADGLPAVKGDPIQLREVVTNLILNSAEAIGDSAGTITVAARPLEVGRERPAVTCIDKDLPEGTYVVLEVADTGCGIKEENISKIFDPYFTSHFTGRGLGLAVVRGVIHNHRGGIQVESRDGHGTTFRIFLPAMFPA